MTKNVGKDGGLMFDHDEDINAHELAQRCNAKLRMNDRVSKALDIRIESSDAGKIVMSMLVTEDMLNAVDTCHGGYIFLLADTAFAYATCSTNNVAVALNCHIDYVRPASKGDRLYAHAEVTYAGRTTGVSLVKVVDQNGRQIAELHARSFNLGRAVLDSAEINGGKNVTTE